mgnify:CR=1 FL=1
MKNKISIEIDLEPILKKINQYIERKLKEEIKSQFQDVVCNFPDIHFPNIEKKLDKLEDWKLDLIFNHPELK